MRTGPPVTPDQSVVAISAATSVPVDPPPITTMRGRRSPGRLPDVLHFAHGRGRALGTGEPIDIVRVLGGPRNAVVRRDVSETDRERPITKVRAVDPDRLPRHIDRVDGSLTQRHRRAVEHLGERHQPPGHVRARTCDLPDLIELGSQNVDRMSVPQDDANLAAGAAKYLFGDRQPGVTGSQHH